MLAEETKVLLCVIAKRENCYIREFVEYYKRLGVTNIVIYDNNDPVGEDFNSVIGDYISSGFVKIIDFRGLVICQLRAYMDCYIRFYKEYDWIMFFDADEFLHLNNHNTVGEYFSSPMFNDFDMIHINWMIYDDNDIVEHTSNDVIDRFTRPMNLRQSAKYTFPENCHIKCVIRGGLDYVCGMKWLNPHTLDAGIITCNASGIPVCNWFYHPYDYTDAYIKHYTTKSVTEYCKKMLRGFPDKVWADRRSAIENEFNTYFFKINKVTPEKINVIDDILHIDLSYLLENKKLAKC